VPDTYLVLMVSVVGDNTQHTTRYAFPGSLPVLFLPRRRKKRYPPWQCSNRTGFGCPSSLKVDVKICHFAWTCLLIKAWMYSNEN
jgi:hypothetical protein